MRSLLPLLCALWLTGLLAGCGERVYREEAYVFGTRVEVSTWGVPEARAREGVGAVLREFDRMHRAYHAWQPSEVSALNAALARGEPHTVAPELAGMLRSAQSLAARGDYLFDPGIGRIVALWGFHADTFVAVTPDAATLAALVAAHPSVRDLSVDGSRVSSRNPAVQIDLGGYAKGWALDRAATLLRQHGIRNALVNIGGNLIALGAKGKTPWRVGIQHPRRGGALATLALHDGEAIGTSGDYQRYFERDGRRFCHLIDPRSGQPATETRSLTVLVSARPEAGLISDVASKPAFIDGPRWRERLAAFGVEHGLRVAADGSIALTAAMARRVELADDAGPVRVLDAVPAP